MSSAGSFSRAAAGWAGCAAGAPAAAADHARRLLVFSHPPRNLLTRATVGAQNAWFGVHGNSFRTFAHPPEAMLEVARSHGFELVHRHTRAVWQVAGLRRAQLAT